MKEKDLVVHAVMTDKSTKECLKKEVLMGMHEYSIQMEIIMKGNSKTINVMDTVKKYTRMGRSNKESLKMINSIPM